MSEDEADRRALTTALQERPLSDREAIRITSAVADEVAALHAAGRAHGRVGPEAVVLRSDGGATLLGPPLPKTGLAAPPERRREDLTGVGRVLAAALGWPPGDALPAPVADVVETAGASDAPAAALAGAIRRLDRDPLALAALEPGRPVVAPPSSGLLARVMPLGDRRTTGFAAAAIGGAAALGAALLLIGAPASRGDLRAAPASPSSAAVAPPAADGGIAAAAAPRSPLDDLLRAAPTRSAGPTIGTPRKALPRTAVSGPRIAPPSTRSSSRSSTGGATGRPASPAPTPKETPSPRPSATRPAPAPTPTRVPSPPPAPASTAPPSTTPSPPAAAPSPGPAAPTPVATRTRPTPR